MNEKIKELWRRGFIISSDAIELLSKIEMDIEKLINEAIKEGSNIITRKTIEKIISSKENIKKEEVKTTYEIKGKNTILKFIQKTTKKTTSKKETYEKVIKVEIKKEIRHRPVNQANIIEKRKRSVGEEYDLKVDIIKNFDVSKHEITINVWVSYYKARLNKIKQFLRNHKDLGLFISIDKIREGDDLSVVGIVRDKRDTNKGIMIVLEDARGLLKVFYPKEEENYELVRSIPLDSVVAFKGSYKEDRKIFLADNVYYPDIPMKIPKKAEEDVWVLFTGDFQIGNRLFLKKPFERFIKWLRGEYGTDKQKELARKVGYIIITGDLVDGVGIYPEQDKELELLTIEEQYNELEKYLLEIPEDKKVIIIPGNHDVVRLAEPQPPLPKEYLSQTYDLENFYYLSNPSYFRIHEKFVVLLYHGYSMDWFVSEIPYIRERGGYENPGIIMEFMLKLRHLSPTHGATPYVPYPNNDPLVIDPVPDIFVTGHIHRTYYGNYKGVDLINASCFQDITKYQLELGHKPDPGKVILKNLKTGQIKILDFLSNT